MFKIIDSIMVSISIFFIKIYQFLLSPDKGIPSIWLKGKICLHTPHCSEYGISALKRYGFIIGTIKMIERISTCHPWNDQKYDPAYYKIVFMSSSGIGVPFLKDLVSDKRFEVIGIVTNCDKPKDRGMNICESIIKTTGKQLGIENIVTPTSINPNKTDEGKEFYSWLKNLQPDFLVVISYGKILPPEILKVAKIGNINAHGSLLPKYRGASPIQSCLLNNESKTGITTMLISEGMDEGDMIKQLSFEINDNRTSKEIIDKIMIDGPKFFTQSIYEFGKGFISHIPQDANFATYCSKIEKNDGLIDPYITDIKTVYSKYRAYKMRPKIWFKGNEDFGKCYGKVIVIEEMIIKEGKYKTMHGTLINDKLELNESIKTLTVKPEGKKAISWEEFKNGYLLC